MNSYELLVPDIGDFENVPVVELLVKLGDRLTSDTPVITLESDKASMEVPADVEGVVQDIMVEEGDLVSQGSPILRYSHDGLENSEIQGHSEENNKVPVPQKTSDVVAQPEVSPEPPRSPLLTRAPASPGVRRLAREWGVDLGHLRGSGAKGRIVKDDIRAHVKNIMRSGNRAEQAVNHQEEVVIDFSQYGEVSEVPLSRIQSISGKQLAKNWSNIPHVTSFDDADITELDQFRKKIVQERGEKLTILPFLIKAVQLSLIHHPQIKSSLQGTNLVIKKHYHIGFACDTPKGLLVPVIRDVDTKGIIEIAAEIRELATLARNGKLEKEQMQGGTFTVSSLGGAGGRYFTPIINAPEVAILALGRASIEPVWDGEGFSPKRILPLSLSWDHRVIDGVAASQFNTTLCKNILDPWRFLL